METGYLTTDVNSQVHVPSLTSFFQRDDVLSNTDGLYACLVRRQAIHRPAQPSMCMGLHILS